MRLLCLVGRRRNSVPNNLFHHLDNGHSLSYLTRLNIFFYLFYIFFLFIFLFAFFFRYSLFFVACPSILLLLLLLCLFLTNKLTEFLSCTGWIFSVIFYLSKLSPSVPSQRAVLVF